MPTYRGEAYFHNHSANLERARESAEVHVVHSIGEVEAELTRCVASHSYPVIVGFSFKADTDEKALEIKRTLTGPNGGAGSVEVCFLRRGRGKHAVAVN